MASTVAAKLKTQTGDAAPAYRLEVDGRELSGLVSASASYAVDEAGNGASEMTITADTTLEAREGGRARLMVGYGEELVEWFTGSLEEPEDDHWGGGNGATAWGPYRELSERMFLEDVDYRNRTLASALLDVYGRARRRGARFGMELKGGGQFVIAPDAEEAIFPLEATFGEAIGALQGSAGYVSTDLPGYGRLHLPRPRPGSYGRTAASYGEGDYPPEAFSARRAKAYGSVVVFARTEGGTYPFPPVIVPVNRDDKRLPRDRAFVVSDFVGSEDDAEREGRRVARELSGSYEWGLEGIPANPDLLPFVQIGGKATEFVD